jgi:hypothetical protein
MSDDFPLLDIQQAVRACDACLAEIIDIIETLHIDCGQDIPPDGLHVLADVAVLRALLADLIPPALQAAIAAEQRQMDDEANRWEPSSY